MPEKWEKLIVQYESVDIDFELEALGDYFGKLGEYQNEIIENHSLLEFTNNLVKQMYYFHIFARPSLEFDDIDPIRERALNLDKDITIGYADNIFGHDWFQHIMSGVMLTRESDGPNSYFEMLVNENRELSRAVELYLGLKIFDYFEYSYRSQSENIFFAVYNLGGGLSQFKHSADICEKWEKIVSKEFRFDRTLDNLLEFLRMDKEFNSDNYGYNNSTEYFVNIDRVLQEQIFEEFKIGFSQTWENVRQDLVSKNKKVKKVLLDNYNGEHRFNQIINLEQLRLGILQVTKDLNLFDRDNLDEKICKIQNNIAFWNQLYQSNAEDFYPSNTNSVYNDCTWQELFNSYQKINEHLHRLVFYVTYYKEEIINTFFQSRDNYNKLYTYKQKIDLLRLNSVK